MSAPQGESVLPAVREERSARLGMWVFLASELMLFAGLFAVYGGYRARDPAMFARGVGETDLVLGTLNTGLLLTSSLLVALAVHARRAERPHVLENGANLWHLVDLVWLFLWPLYYLLWSA
jgi:heme/copper-type cytochrome/quinol oxidase subunit 3